MSKIGRSGSTRIDSDRLESRKNIKLNEIETFTHLKIKIPVKRLATFLRVVLCSQAAILYSKYQFLSDSSRVPSIPDPAASISTDDHGPR